MVRRLCPEPGCPNLVTTGRCADHQRAARARRVDNAAYGTADHRRFRAAVLKRDPICVLCDNAPSHVADHYPLTRRELVDRGLDPNDPARGRGVCDSCHGKHTARTSPGGWNDRT